MEKENEGKIRGCEGKLIMFELNILSQCILNSYDNYI